MMNKEDKSINKEFQRPKTFREEILERIVRLEESVKNHTAKHWWQVLIECSILAAIIVKVILK